MQPLFQLLRGFLMGSADLVPGVSGGTVALVLGIYRRLVTNIKTGSVALGYLVKGDARGSLERWKAVDWGFLLPLFAGIVAAVITLAGVIRFLRDEFPIETAAAFFGLVAGSILIAWSLLGQRDRKRLGVMAATAVATFLVLGFRSGAVHDPAIWAFFVAGAVAICAMILPGISGAFLLLAIGMYDAVIEAVDERSLVIVAVVGLGAIVGLGLFAPFLDRLLSRHPDTVLAALIGLMAGSLRVLWPWPDGTESTTLALPGADEILVPVVIALAGAALVIGISRLSRKVDVPELVS